MAVTPEDGEDDIHHNGRLRAPRAKPDIPHSSVSYDPRKPVYHYPLLDSRRWNRRPVYSGGQLSPMILDLSYENWLASRLTLLVIGPLPAPRN